MVAACKFRFGPESPVGCPTPSWYTRWDISEALDKAAYFNQMFAKKATVADPNMDTTAPDPIAASTLSDIRFSPKIVHKLLTELDESKGPGIDNIHGLVLKNCADSLGDPLARLFQRSFDTGTLPSEWKCAKITPIHKKGSRSDPNNYRPVALLPLVSKVMEKIYRIPYPPAPGCQRRHLA